MRSLRLCRSEYHLDEVLSSLPESLDETYERMLCNIDKPVIEDARRILTLLCFAARPLTVPELIDGIAVETEGSIGLNHKRRLQDADDILDICPGFVDIGLDADLIKRAYYEEDSTPTVRIAHFSIQEYLESERIRDQKAAMFSLNSVTANVKIAQICLIYLLEGDLCSSILDHILVQKFPLAQFAAMYWYRYYRDTVDPTPGLDALIVKVFQNQYSFINWVKLYDMDQPSWKASIDISRELDTVATPVYYASLLGLNQALLELIGNRQIGSMSADVNAQGGYHGNALQAASSRGHEKVVQMLLGKGAKRPKMEKTKSK